jgi:histidinol phosphatase-like enzyme
MIKCIFLDRDGVINKDTGYFYEFSKIIWNKKIFKTIKFIKKKKNKNMCYNKSKWGCQRILYRKTCN